MAEVLISFDEIRENDVIRTVRTNVRDNVIVTIQGEAQWKDSDGDWVCGDELLTYRDSLYEESYYFIKSSALPQEPGSVVTFPNLDDNIVYALKLYEADLWVACFPDGSYAVFDSVYISRKDWQWRV